MFLYQILLALPAACLLIFLSYRVIPADRLRRLAVPLLLLWAFAVLWLTLLSREPSDEVRLLLNPLEGLHLFGMLENMLLFVPLGVLLRWRKPSCRMIPGALAGFGVSVLIELAQLVTRRGLFASEDLIANTLGCLLGIAAAMLSRRLAGRTDDSK